VYCFLKHFSYSLKEVVPVQSRQKQALDLGECPKKVVGWDTKVPVVDGTERRYVSLDNGASTPILEPVRDIVDEAYKWYSSVHRGAGFKSRMSTWLYETARKKVANFAGADDGAVVIFVRNATEGINVLATRLGLQPDDVVLTTVMEHHSHLLPWRQFCRVEHVQVDDDGRIDLDHLQLKLTECGSNVRLVAISGASNVTGVVPPVSDIARIAHQHGALISVDAAQLAPHRKITMGPTGAEDSIDFLTCSGHKMYAPLGSGALIARRDLLTQEVPHLRGGGTVAWVGLDEVVWNPSPGRDEAGSPNVIGAVAFGAAASILGEIGFDSIVEHEREITTHALDRLTKIPGVTVYGPKDVPVAEDKMGVICFNVDGYAHEQVASILANEHAVGVRNGRFCAQPYLERLLGLSTEEVLDYRTRMLSGEKFGLPGMVRASFGIYNTIEDVDILCDAVEAVTRGEHTEYDRDEATGDFIPKGFAPNPADYFSW
jgi:cysteine desulfurase / selenocysteine lyase